MIDMRWLNNMQKLAIVWWWVSIVVGLIGCKSARSPNDADVISSVKATSIKHVVAGNEDRCGADDEAIGSHGNIYDDVYDKSTAFFKILVDQVQKDQTQRLQVDSEQKFILRPGLNPDARTRKTILESIRMLLNIMGDDGTTNLPDRPLHPAAFFSVIRDFEANKSDKWSHQNYFGVTTNNCGPKKNRRTCYGMFQIDLIDLGGDSVSRLKQMCGSAGLGFLNHTNPAGALDFCAALQWWNGGQKCSNLRIHMDHVLDNQIPTETGDIICVPQSQVYSKPENPCNRPHTPWSPQTFAYGYYCAYVQHNQWKQYGIYDTWGRAYTGFNTTGISSSIPDDQEVKGYEYCAVKRYLKRLKAANKCIEGGDDFVVTSRPPPPQLIRASVADFACKIGLLPAWLSPSDCQKVDPLTPSHLPASVVPQSMPSAPTSSKLWSWIKSPFDRNNHSAPAEEVSTELSQLKDTQAGCENGWVTLGD